MNRKAVLITVLAAALVVAVAYCGVLLVTMNTMEETIAVAGTMSSLEDAITQELETVPVEPETTWLEDLLDGLGEGYTATLDGRDLTLYYTAEPEGDEGEWAAMQIAITGICVLDDKSWDAEWDTYTIIVNDRYKVVHTKDDIGTTQYGYRAFVTYSDFQIAR